MAVIHLAGAIASFLIGGYLLIDSAFGMSFGSVGLLYCLQTSSSHGTMVCSNATVGTLFTKFAIGIGLLVIGVFIAGRSRN